MTARGTVTNFGYRRIRCKDRKLRFEHVLVWEHHYGPVPPGKEIHHKNGDKLDNRIENLAVLTRLEHKRIHSDCIRHGDTWLKRCHRCNTYKLIDTEFYVYPGRNGVMSKCKRCCCELASYYDKRRREKRREAKAKTIQSPVVVATTGDAQ